MSAEVLRAAARSMRERAQAAMAGPWEMPESIHGDPFIVQKGRGFLSGGLIGRASGEDYGRGNAQHIASWHPAVALAVADWLDACAEFEAHLNHGSSASDEQRWRPHQYEQALTVARTYLGAA